MKVFMKSSIFVLSPKRAVSKNNNNNPNTGIQARLYSHFISKIKKRNAARIQ